MTMPSKPSTGLLPVASLLLAASLWGVIWYPLRLIEAQGLPGLWITLVSYGAALVAGSFVLWRNRADFARRPLLLGLLGVTAGWANLAFFLAVLEGPVVRVLLLFYLSPVWMVLLGRLSLGEHLARAALLALALAMSGAVVMLWQPGFGVPWPRGAADWLAVTAGLAFAAYNVLVRRLQEIPVAAKTVTAWAGVVSLTALLLPAAAAPLPAGAGTALAGAVALGLLGIAVMTLAAQYGVTHMPVHRSAVLMLFQLVVGVVSSQWLTEEVIRPLEWLGGVLILAGAWIVAHQQRHPMTSGELQVTSDK
jgi:drug/metabolite transporter (DMT)-like permease